MVVTVVIVFKVIIDWKMRLIFESISDNNDNFDNRNSLNYSLHPQLVTFLPEKVLFLLAIKPITLIINS